jgi:hypothetical protein
MILQGRRWTGEDFRAARATESGLESAIRGLRVKTYKGQLAMCERVRETLSKYLMNVGLTGEEKVAIGHRCDEALNQGDALRVLLSRMERLEREDRATQLI